MTTYGEFPTTRLRRNRLHDWTRQLVAENRLHVEDLIWSIFVREDSLPEDVPVMPGVKRYSLNDLVGGLAHGVKLGIKSVAIFPAYENTNKDEKASLAFDEEGLVPQAVRLLKQNYPSLGVITDAALDPFTIHGHDGIIINDYVDNDITLEAVARHALVQARAGADIIAPSEMMDGRIGAIRKILDQNGFEKVGLLAYSTKYASSFYGPYRTAVNTIGCLGKANKKTYYMDPANINEALREVALDLQEGADMVMVKPGLPYLDVIKMIKDTFKVPTIAFQVSGEYAMLKISAQADCLDYNKTLMETLIGFKRAGADGIITYAAPEAAALLKSGFDV
jgi:porphobilinogen synthase